LVRIILKIYGRSVSLHEQTSGLTSFVRFVPFGSFGRSCFPPLQSPPNSQGYSSVKKTQLHLVRFGSETSHTHFSSSARLNSLSADIVTLSLHSSAEKPPPFVFSAVAIFLSGSVFFGCLRRFEFINLIRNTFAKRGSLLLLHYDCSATSSFLVIRSRPRALIQLPHDRKPSFVRASLIRFLSFCRYTTLTAENENKVP